jgi:hypothetical protein
VALRPAASRHHALQAASIAATFRNNDAKLLHIGSTWKKFDAMHRYFAPKSGHQDAIQGDFDASDRK